MAAPGPVQHLIIRAEERASPCGPQVELADRAAAQRADLFRVHLPMLLQFETAVPLQEIKAVGAGLLDHGGKPAWRQVAQPGGRMDTYPEQHLVLDDVAHVGEDGLVQKRITGHDIRHGLQLAPGQLWIPGLVHHVRTPIVDVVQRLVDQAHGARVEVQLTVVEHQRYPRRAWLPFVDAPAAEHHQVDAQRVAAEFQQEVLAPTADRLDPAALQR